MKLAVGLATLNGGGSPSIQVITPTNSRAFDDTSTRFSVLRQPKYGDIWNSIRTSDLVHAAGPVLKILVPRTPFRAALAAITSPREAA